MRLRAYFERIGWSGAREPTLDTLGALLRAHNHNIPFENLDVLLGKTLTTRVEDAYEKIVNRRRGGWCYEQNGLFGWALSQIGFGVTRVAAAVMRAQRGPTSHATHLALLVSLPGDETRWLVDVGFGGSLLRPIPLQEGTDYHAPFTIGLRQVDSDYWQFWEVAGEDEFSFDFRDLPADERALSERCKYLQTSPESGFVQNLVCQLRGPDSHKVLRGRVVSRVTREGIRKRVLESDAELVAVLNDDFRLVTPEAAELWGQICDRHQQISARD